MSLARLVRSRLPRPAHTLRVGRRSRRRGADLAPPRQRKQLYEPLEPRLLLSGSPFTYEAAPDAPVNLTLKLVQQVETPTLQLVDHSGAVVASQALASTWWIYVFGSDLDDILTVDLTEAFAVPVTFEGRGHGAVGDVLRVLGGGGRAAAFTRQAAAPDAGTVTVDGATVQFAGVEPVEIADMGSLAITTSGSQDELTVDSPAPGQGRVSGTSDGAAFEVAFANVFDVVLDTGAGEGAAGDDTVIIDDSVPASGIELSVQTGAGRDTLVGPDGGATWVIDDAGGGTVAGVSFAGVESVRGGTGEDTLVGPDTDSAWTISGPNAGTLNTLAFEDIENLTGGAGADTFTFVSGGSLSGQLRGGAGIDTLVGADQDNVWQITGADSGSLNGQAFEEIENLRGGAGADRFVFTGGSISGTVEGGAGVNTLDYSAEGAGVAVDLAAGAATGTAGFAQITEIVGGAGLDTLRGPNADTTWTITGAGAGTVGNVTFTAVESLEGGSGDDLFALGALGGLGGALVGGEGADTLLAADLANAWEVVGPDAGFLNGLAFRGIEILLGGALDDVFVFALGGSVSNAVIGGAGLDRVRGADRRNRWRLGGAGVAELNGTALAGIEALEGGADVDEFAFDDGADFGGALEGGAGADGLDYAAYTSPVAVDLATGAATGTAGITGIDAVTGGTGSDTLRGPAAGTTWTVTGLNAGTVDGVSFTGIENLTGGAGDDVFVIAPGGGAAGVIEGGEGGFDTIEVRRGGYASVVSAPTGPTSGRIVLDGAVIQYTGFEPLLVDLDLGTDVEFDLGDLGAQDDIVELRLVAGDTFVLDSLNGTFEDTQFTDPGGTGSVQIRLGGGDDSITFKNLGTLDASLTVEGEADDDTYKFDDDWGDVTIVEAGSGGTDTLDFGLYSDAPPRDAITLVPGLGGSLTIDAEAADGSSISLSAASAANIESLINANLDLSGMADAPADELIAGLNGLVTFLRNLAAVGNFATALPILGGSADVAVAKLLGFAEAIDELRLEVQRFLETTPSVTTDDLIGYLNGLFTSAGRTLTYLGAAILSPQAVDDAAVEPADTYAFALSLNGGTAIPISATGVDTVADLVAALNAALSASPATSGVVGVVERGGRVAFQVVGTEVNTFAVTAQVGAARTKLGFPSTALSLSDVQSILRNLGALNVNLGSAITLAVSFDSGTPQLRFNVDWRGARTSSFFYNLGPEAEGLGLAFDLDAKLTARSELVLDVQLGLDLDADTTFFLDVDTLRAGVEVTSTAVSNAGLNIGFLDVLASGTVSLDAGVTASLSDTQGITPAQLLTAPEAAGGLLAGGSLSVTAADGTGTPSFSVALTLSVDTGLDSLGGFSGTGTLSASGNPFDGETIDLQVGGDYNLNFPSFNNLSAAGVISLIGRISAWLDGLRDGALLSSIEIPFVQGGLDAILDLAEILDDALLYDEGPDNVKDGADRLVTDLNDALAQAGLDRLIRAQGNGTRISLIAVDPAITSFSLAIKSGSDPDDDAGGYADLGFVGSPVSSAATTDAPQTIVATNNASARGRLTGRAGFTVTVNTPGGAIVRDVLVTLEATTSNEGVGDDVAKLVNASNAPLFRTAQELAERLDEFIPGDVSFNPSTKLLTYTITFSDVPLFTVELPVDFALDLGPIGGIESNTRLVIESEGGFNFTLGFDLSDSPSGSAGTLTPSTTLGDLGVDVTLEEGATAPAAPRTIVGQLSGPATFTISYNPAADVTIPLLRSGQDINATHQERDQSEATIAVNPVKPENIIIAVNDLDDDDGIFGSASSSDWVYVTTNGGQTWTRHQIPVPAGTPAPTRAHGDPTIVFSRDGSRAVFVHMVDKVPAEHGDDDLHVMVSAVSLADGSGNVGTSWTVAQTGIVGGTFALDQDGDGHDDDDDKQFLAVGPRSATQPHLDRFVLSWHRGGVIMVSTSEDGLTWTTPRVVGGMTGGSSTAAPSGTSIDAIPAIGPDGQIYIAWEEYGTPGVSRILFDSSLDGGLTWGGGLDTRVFFDTGLFNIDAADELVLNAVAAQMTADPQLLVTVAGYTDTAGEATANQILSDNRADAVRDYLVAAGVDPSRIVVLGFGETRLAVSTADGVSEPQNRRAELTFDRVIYTGSVSVFNDFHRRAVITGASPANPVQITTAEPHQLQTGAQVVIEDIVGMTELNDRTFTITVISPTTFTLDGEDGTAHTAYVSGGTWKARGAIQAATQANPAVITTPAPHGLITGDTIRISGVVGMTQLNNRNFDVTVLTPTTFQLDNVDSTGFGAYASGGSWIVVDDYTIPAQPDRGIWMGLSMDVDRSGGPRDGRIYIAFADQGDLDGLNEHGTADHDDTDIFVIASDNGGATWNALASSPLAVGADQVRVNDVTTGSQFFSWLAVDQSTGNVAVSWYDARHDDGLLGAGDLNGLPNDDVRYFAAVSTDFGRTWTNLPVSDGVSTSRGTRGDYGDYTGLAFVRGTVHMTWADSSDSTAVEAPNPDGAASFMDAYYDRIELSNETFQDLLDDINAALDAITVADGPDADLLPDVLGQKFEARESAPGSQIVEIVALDPAIMSFTVSVASTADPAFRDLGFQLSTPATRNASGDLVVRAGKKAPAFVGRLTADQSFTVTLAGQTPVTVTVPASATNSPFGANRSILDLVKDVQDAIDAALTPPAPGQHVITVSSVGGRLLFTRPGATAAGPGDSFTIAPTASGSAAQLGITGTLVSDEADLVITRADGTTTQRVSLDIDKDSDGTLEESDVAAITIGDVIAAIQAATAGGVQVVITPDDPATPVNEAGKGLTLRDTAWASGGHFMVAAANGSLAAVELGIIGKDGTPEGQPGEPDGKIVGAKIAGASLLDRLFLTSTTPSSVIDASVSVKAALLVEGIRIDDVANTVITSERFEFESEHVGKVLTIKGVNGFTAGTYTITAVNETDNTATLDASPGSVGRRGGVGVLSTGIDATASVGFVDVNLDSTTAKLGAALSLGFNTGSAAWTNDNRLTLRELVAGLSDPLSLIAPPDWSPLTGEPNFADLDLTVGISLDGASPDFTALAGDLLSATPGVTVDVKALGDPFLGTRFAQAGYAKVSDTSFTVHGNFESKLPVGVAINFRQGTTDHLVTVASRSHSSGVTTVTVTTEGGFAVPSSLTGYEVTLRPKVDVATTGLDNLLNFEDIDFGDILAGLRALLNFLGTFETFGFLNTDIPLINQSVNDLLGFAVDFTADLEAAEESPAGALQVLETKINEAVGLGLQDLGELFTALQANPMDAVLGLSVAPNDVLDLSLVGGSILKLDLTLGKTFSGGLDVAIPDINFGAGVFAALGLDSVLDLAGSAGLFAEGAVMLRLQLGIDLTNPTNVYLFEDTGLEAALGVGGENVAFRVGVGPFALAIASTEDQTAEISISASATLGFDPSTPFDADHKIALATVLGSLGTYLDLDVAGEASGLLPVFFPRDSNLIGEIKIGEAAGAGFGQLENIGNVTIKTGSETPASDAFVIDLAEVVGGIAAFDFSSFSIFDNIFLAIDGIDLALEFIENLVGGRIGNLSIPLVGDELAKGATFIEDFRREFVQPLRQAVEDAQDMAQDFTDPDENVLSRILFELLAPKSVVGPNGLGLGILKPLDGSFDPSDDDSPADFIALRTNLDDFLFNPATTLTLSQVYIEWDVTIGSVLANLSPDIGFDLGIPGLGLQTEGNITLDIAWELDLGFGLSGAEGFYLLVDDAHELLFDVSVSIPATISGTLGFLGLRASDKTINVNGTPYNTGLNAMFALDISESGASGADANRLGFTELGSISLTPKIAASAAATLDLELGLSPELFAELFGPDAAGIISGFPKLRSDFIFLWEVGTRGSGATLDARANSTTFVPLDAFGDAIGAGLKLVAFQDVRLDLGSFLSDVLGPLVDEVAKFTEPMQPLIDFITSPIPIIGELGLEITWLDLAQMIAGDALNVRLIEAIAEIVTLINDIAAASGAGEIALPIGDLVLYNDNVLSGVPGFTSAQLWDRTLDLGGVFDTIQGTSGLMNDLVSAAGGIGDAIGDLISGGGLSGGQAQAAQTMQRLTRGQGGFSFPFLEDPSEIFGLLMGEPADLIVFDLEPDPAKAALEFEFEWSQFFTIFGPLGVSIGLLVEFTADGKFGYDTLGIQQFVETGFRNPLLLLNGFYIADDPRIPGQDTPELTFLAELQAAAELNLGIARAGVAAALGFLIQFDLFDPNRDLKIRIDELVGNVVNQLRAPSDAEKLLAPLAIFDVSGEIFARLFAFLEIDFGFFSFEKEFPIFGPVTLLSFEVDFFRPPILASEQETGDLVINAGQFAKQRLLGNAEDVAEHLIIRSTGTSGDFIIVEVKAGNSALGDDAQTFLPYRVRRGQKIIIDGGEGDDIFDLSGFTHDGVLFEINLGAGNDQLIWNTGAQPPAGRFNVIQGGAGDDIIQGSGGSDLIYGNSGNDTITAGGGSDLVFGDEGEVGAGFARGLVKPTDGRDNVDGGDGADIVFGGGGKDTVQGGAGSGTDLVIGGGALVTFTSASALQVFSNFDVTGSVDDAEDPLFDPAAGDTILGGPDADILYGTAGPDTIQGGGGNDIIFGLGGFDTIDAGAGDDVVFGDDGRMVPDGDDLDADPDPVPFAGGEADVIQGGPGADVIFGGGGADLIQGGDDDDDIYGGSGADTIFGDNGSIIGGVPTPAEGAGDGGDLIFGEGEPDRIYGGGGNDVIDGGAGNDIIVGGSGSDSIITNKSNDFMDGGEGGDFYTVYFQGGTASSLMNVIDTGASGTDVFVALGTVFNDRFLLRANTDGAIAFVALINTVFHVERVNYSFVERVVVNGSFGDDYFASDDTAGEVTLNGEFGDDIFQIGQIFKSNRGDQTDAAAPFDFSDITGVRVDDAFANIETTRGWLSNGISAPMTINGGLGNDLFTVFHNKAVLQLNGEEGDDTFEIRAFALAGSQEPQRERTDISGGAGADLVQYAVNAPVNIDGGDGFDTVIVIGTEFGDDLVITEDGVFGAGLNVNFVRIESLRVDGAEGNDRFFVLSTSEKFMTEIFGGLGEDTFFMSGDTPPIVSNDLKGHSGVITHEVESTDLRYDGQELFGISANVADNDEPFAVIRTTGGSTIVTEGGSLVDSYQIVLTRQPTKDVLVRALAPIPTPGDRERRAMAFRLDSATKDELSADGTALTLRFTAANWYIPQTVEIYADDAPLVDRSVSAAFGLFTRPELAGADPDADLTTGVPFDMNDDAYEGVRFGVVNHLVSAASAILQGTLVGIVNGANPVVTIPDPGTVAAQEIVGRKLFITAGKGAGQLRSVLASVAASGHFQLTLDRAFAPTDLPTTSSQFFIAIDDALVGTVSAIDEAPSGLPATTEPVDRRSTFTDSAAAFPTAGQGLRGAILEIIGGPGAGQQRLILGHDPADPTHTLILNGPWREDPVAGQSLYRIERYDGLAIPSVTVQINDDDRAGVIVDETKGYLDNGDGTADAADVVDDSDTITAVIEGGDGNYLGEQDVLRIRLSRDPGSEVRVGLTYPAQLEVRDLSGAPITAASPLVFDSTNWHQFQVVRVAATGDDLREGFHTGLIEFSIEQGTADATLSGTDIFNLITEENAVFFVGLSQLPIASSVVVTLNGEVLTRGAEITTPGADYVVLSNKILFLDGTGDLQAVFGTLSVAYQFVNPGFSSAFTAPVLVRIHDEDAPTVLVRETGGSTDVIELTSTGTGPDSINNPSTYAAIQALNLSPWNDSYEVVLTGQPTGEVTITLAPQVTKTTRTGGIRTDAVQVAISSSDSRVSAGPNPGELTVTFDATNWDEPVVIKVSAIDDAQVDGGDTQVFAPGPDTVSGILGPVFIQGAGGDGSLAMQAPLMLPGEINKRAADGDVLAFEANPTPGGLERMFVLTSVLEAKRTALGFASIDDLIGLTVEMAEGNGTNVLLDSRGTATPFDDKVFDRFWLIADILDAPDATQKVLLLQNPSQLDVAALPASAVPNTSSKFAITTLSANFFVDETTQVDFMFVNDEDSLADHTGYLTPSRLYGMNMGPDLVIGGELRPGGITYGDLEVLRINLGKGNNTFHVLGTPTRADGYQTWTFLNTGDETVPWFGVMGDTVHVALNATDQVVRTGTVTAAQNADEDSLIFKHTVTVDGAVFADNALQGYTIAIGGAGSAQTRRILGNTGNVLWVDRAWDTLPTGQAYTITNEADGAFAVNTQAGDDTVDAAASSLGITIFGGLGADRLTGGSGADVIFGDRGRVDYFDEVGAVVTRLGDAPEPITGFVTAQVVAGMPGPGQTDLFHLADSGASFPVPDDAADGLGTDDIGLRGLYVDINNGFGFLQTIKRITGNTATVLTIAEGFDPEIDLPGPVSGNTSAYRISTYPEDQTDGVVRGANLLITVDNGLGAGDTIHGGAGTDQIFGGAGDDEIHAGAGDDLVIGDAGRLDRARDAAAPADPGIGDVVGSTYDRLRTIATATGGQDKIYGDGGDDIILGGTASDTIQGGDDDDIALGDFGEVRFFATNLPRVVETTFRTLGAGDTMRGGAGEDVLAGGTGDDVVDGQRGDDLLFGDQVRLEWNAGVGAAVTPRFRTLSGATIYDANGNPQVGGAWQSNPAGMPAWADWTMTMGEAAGGDNATGSDYLAGGADDDTIFGQLGDDTIQGDGAIDSLTDGGIAVGAHRYPAGLLQVSPSFEDPGDGDDYIEGNAGKDVVFGNLGQDDIIGGSSELFSLNTPALRPDDADLLFGGAGTDLERNNPGDTSAEGHARDADVILGDNGNIFRLVNGSGFLQFNYDNSNSLKIKPRAAQLLDYTPGGPDEAATTTSGWLVPGDIGAADELHGESGDDVLYGMAGGDVLFGEGQDDDLIGGYGSDWISGGTGQDGVLGDDGRIFTSRNGQPEPLNGVMVPADQTTIATPGNLQMAVINVLGELKKSVDLTPFNVDPDNVGEDPLFDPVYADDIIYGGLGGDFLHGGPGDDAISGAEALPLGAALLYLESTATDPAWQDGTLVLTGYDRPVNPLLGNILGHEALRAEELSAYDEFDPWAKIFVSGYEFFLNFDHTEGPLAGASTTIHTDGNDAIFGDLGNDWLVGGTGRDNLYGGYGNDLLNADDNLATAGNANTAPDGPEASYEDRAYGGAGRDVLIANTGGDRLIDWVGEFNAYIVPFAPFGAAVVSRTLQPQLPEFLYALSKADGADQTRASASTAARNGEPDGELGLVIQRDLDWRDQTGAPDDPQAGNIPGGRRDVLRSADFNNGSIALSAFAPDSGVWTVTNGELKVAAASSRGDAVSVFHVDHQLPGYFEIVAQVRAEKPLAGWNANAYVIFDYVSATDFKFAGINVSTNKIEMGRRTAQGWLVDAQSSVQVKPEQYYTMLVAVNGTTVTVGVDGKSYFSYAYPVRTIDGYTYGLNWGLVGVGSNNARGSFDNIRVQALPPAWTLRHTEDFGDGVADLFTGSREGTWQVASGRYTGTPAAGEEGFSLVDLGIGRGVTANSLIELSTTFTAAGLAGLIFDQYGPASFKFVAVDVPGQRVVVGHRSPQKGLVIDASTARSIAPGDHTLVVTLKGTTVAILLDGQAVQGHVFNAVGVDGAFGLFARGGAASFDSVTIKTDDPAFRQTGTALRVAGQPVERAALEALTEQALDAVAAQAVLAWDGAIAVSDVRLVVADLAEGLLGQTLGSTIFVDDDAAGFGWFIDYRTAADVPAGRVDLLRVVSHELGHALGLAHGEGIMDAALAPGMRLFVGDPGQAETAAGEPLADAVPMFSWDRGRAAEPAVVSGGRIDWGHALEAGRAGLQPQFPDLFAASAMTGASGEGLFSRLIDWTGRRLFGRSLGSERPGGRFPGVVSDVVTDQEER